MRRDHLSPAIAETASTYRRLQRSLQRHPTMQGRMLLRLYQWSNARILCFRSAISKSFEFDIQLKAYAGPGRPSLRSGPGKSTWRVIANV
jgi:hypothetical protein